MAQYTVDFTADTPGSPPAGMTERWTTTGSPVWNVFADAALSGGKGLRFTSTSDAVRLLSIDAVDADGDRDDVEILVRYRSTTASSGRTRGFVAARATAPLGAPNGYRLYFNSGKLVIGRVLSGVYSALAEHAVSFSANKWYYVRFRVNGSSLAAKIWSDTEPERAWWDVATTDLTITGTGWAGLHTQQVGTSQNDWDFAVVATNGDTATFADLETTPEVLAAQASVAVITEHPVDVFVAQASVQAVVLQPDPVPPTVATTIEVSQLALQTVLGIPPTLYVEASQLSLQVVAFTTAARVDASQLSAQVVVEGSPDIYVSQVSLQAVVAGRTETTQLKAWTATLDGHDYYFLQLPQMTLVYDFHAEQWYNWGTGSAKLWRAQVGIDWNANVAAINGGLLLNAATSVIVGDSINGALYFLDPNLSEDDDEVGSGTVPFLRVSYGQLAMRGIDFVPCNGVQVTGSIGVPTAETPATNLSVELLFSDDQGFSFVSAGMSELAFGGYEEPLHWRSLGSVRGPGRLFRLEDWGALIRVDGMDMDDGQGGGDG
jgi:hypothetical protein